MRRGGGMLWESFWELELRFAEWEKNLRAAIEARDSEFTIYIERREKIIVAGLPS